MKNYALLILTVALSLTFTATSHASGRICGVENSQWMESLPTEQRDLVLLKTSVRITTKWAEITSQKNAKPEDELWGYKILSVGHFVLSRSPYATPKIHALFSRMEETASSMIRGQIDLKLFKEKMISLSSTIDEIGRKTEAKNTTFVNLNMASIKAESDCVLITAMSSSAAVK
jgi:hypothetical protein